MVGPSWFKDEDPNDTINIGWGQPGILAIVSQKVEYKNFMILKSEQQNPHNDLRSNTKTGSNQRGGKTR
jgi:hypothetical protein